MATRAFLLCGDEKAVHAVTQILDELEVSFEHSSEPPFALKRLAAQHFDLLIVDCDNAQNATQVFNSARASNLNKNSIAIAIVEGKAGVPNAFRLGASLVLTKPVSLEQTRNTLRTGIGMTRTPETKPVATAPVAASAPPVTPSPVHPASAPAVPASPVSSASTLVIPAVPTPIAPVPVAKAPSVLAPVAPVPTAPPPTIPASITKSAVPAVPTAEKPVAIPRPPGIVPASTQEPKRPLTEVADPKPTVGVAAFAKATAATSAAPPSTSKFDSVFSGTTATSMAVTAGETKAKTSPEKAKADQDDDSEIEDASPTLSVEDPLAEEDEALDPMKDHGVPSFGGLGKQPFAGYAKPERGRGKGALITAVILLLMGAGGYAAWLTQPAFKNLVVWEYSNVQGKIAALLGHPAPVTAFAKPQPAAVPPAPVEPAASTTQDGSPTIDPNASQGSAANPTNFDPTASAATTPTLPPNGTNPKLDSPTQKGAAVQTARQDTTAGHAGSNPALVPASLPATAAKPAGDLVEVPEDYADDQVVRRVHPVYPKQARLKKVQGTVVLQAIVNKQGKVDSLQLVSGDALLAQAAADAVKLWRYKPYSHNGEPADFQTRVTVDFKLP